MPPKRAPNYGHADAKSYKPICFQTGNRTGAFWELMPEFQNTDSQSEDCLYLNIWGPRKPVQKKVPVIIWVCGGGFREGGGHAPYQVPDQWIQRTQTHVVVTFKYMTLNCGLYETNVLIYLLSVIVSVSSASLTRRSPIKTLGCWISGSCTCSPPG
jgi:carboxylesterase type B